MLERTIVGLNGETQCQWCVVARECPPSCCLRSFFSCCIATRFMRVVDLTRARREYPRLCGGCGNPLCVRGGRELNLVPAGRGMGQFSAAVSVMNVSAMKFEMCFTLECHQSAKVRTAVVWEACKRKSQSSTCPRSFQLCSIYCDSWCIPWIWKCHYCIFVHR